MRTSLARPSVLLLFATVAGAHSVAAQGGVNKYGNPQNHPPKPTTAAITAEELRTRLYIFSDDSMQGRAIGFVGNMKGTNYLAAELKRLGVEPAGDNGTSYFQRLPYVTRKFSDRSTLSVGGAALAFNTDFVPIPGNQAPKAIANVPVIYGGVEGDTTTQITPAQAAGKFVIMSPGAAGQGGGRGGRGGGGGRGGALVLTADNAARVPLPNPAFQGTAGDIVVSNGAGGVAVIRNGQLIAGTLPAGQTPATVQAKLDAIAANSRDSSARIVERRDTLVAAARRFLTSGYQGTVTFRGETVTLDSAQVVALGCAPAGGGRGGAGGRGAGVPANVAPAALPAGCPAAPAGGGRAGAPGGRGGAFGGAGGGISSMARFPDAIAIAVVDLDALSPAQRAAFNNPIQAVSLTAPVPAPTASLRITAVAAAKLLGAPVSGLQAGAAGGTVTANLMFVEEPSDWARNVVGIVRGSDPKLKGQFVAIGGHNDHNRMVSPPVDHDSLKAYRDAFLKLQFEVVKGDLRAAAPAKIAAIKVNMDSIRKLHPVVRMDSVNNGADDDGSGAIGVLEIAEAIVKMPVKPKRSVIFVFHTGEEGGLLGSRYFTDNPTVPIDSVVAGINIDMIGRGRAEDMVGGGPTYLGALGSKRLSSQLDKAMHAVNTAESPANRLRLDNRFDDATLGTSVDGKPVSWPGYNNLYGRSDHANYANKCIPIVFFFTGLHGDYHQLTDEPEYIDYPHYSLITNYIRDLTVNVANQPTRPALDNPCVRR